MIASLCPPNTGRLSPGPPRWPPTARRAHLELAPATRNLAPGAESKRLDSSPSLGHVDKIARPSGPSTKHADWPVPGAHRLSPDRALAKTRDREQPDTHDAVSHNRHRRHDALSQPRFHAQHIRQPPRCAQHSLPDAGRSSTCLNAGDALLERMQRVGQQRILPGRWARRPGQQLPLW